MTPEQIRTQWQGSKREFLPQRRWIIGLSLISMLSMSVIALFQTGILRRVPEPPLPGLDADKINGSTQAYTLLNTPDAVLGIGNYAVTLGLAAVSGADRTQKQPWLPLLLCAKATGDAALAAKMLAEQPIKYKSFSLWTIVSGLAVFGSAACSYPEARAAFKALR